MRDDMPRRTYTTPFTLAFGARLRKLRIDADHSLESLARKTDISKGHLSSIEHGLAMITIESLYRIAAGLDISPMRLLGFQDEDEYAVLLDLIWQLPRSRRKTLKKILKKWTAAINAS